MKVFGRTVVVSNGGINTVGELVFSQADVIEVTPEFYHKLLKSGLVDTGVPVTPSRAEPKVSEPEDSSPDFLSGFITGLML